jgi:apolipoprotein N-acyltransferase
VTAAAASTTTATANAAAGRSRLGLALLAGGLLGAANLPPLLPGAEWLVLPALLLWFVVATGSQHPGRAGYLLGCVHMALFAASLRHFMVPAYLAVVVLGGVYYALANLALAGLSRTLRPWAFGLAVAGSFWWRANMPQLSFPHGQPSHALWQWPELLHAASLGGEALVNVLLATLAAAIAELGRSWRCAVPALRPALLALFAIGSLVAATTLWGRSVHRAALATIPATAAPLRIAAIEPGFHPHVVFTAGGDWKQRYRTLFQERLLAPTRTALVDQPPPDLVLWPESSVPEDVPRSALAGDARLRFDLPASSARLLVGANLRAEPDGVTPIALLVALPTGAVLGLQEKRQLVAGGEYLPFVSWLPTGLGAWVRELVAEVMGAAPNAVPGVERAPLRTAADQPFGALMCFDNAFPGPAAAQVAAGAQFLCVLSNEAWYRGGGELEQLVAMSVLRALETATPLVRCTQDGWSAVVDRSGRLAEHLPIAAAPQPGPRILRASVWPGPGALPSMAWLRAAVGPGCGLGLGLLLLHAFVRWARLRVARTASRPDGGHGPTPAHLGTGS